MLAISVKNLVKIYSGGVIALNGINLAVEEGSSHAILGPNGAGKTTLIRILTTQIKPTRGEAKVFGFDVVNQGNKVRELIGYVPQEMSLWSDLTGYENMLIYSKIYGIDSSKRGSIIEELLDFMDLREAANRLVKTYSGGMIRRLEIAIAMMPRPRLLILDEPTIGLDPRARRIVWERLQAYKKEHGATIFFATHYMDEADKYADMVSLIDRGKIVAEGAPSNLKKLIESDRIILKITGNAEDAKKLLLEYSSSIIISNNREITLAVKDPATILPIIIEKLYSRGFVVLEAKIVEATLDDVFIKLTGRSIGEEEKGTISEVMSVRRAIIRGG
ncbi:ATP-binding cassette domain-containing protein [Ignisphaera sp. 4213-co]|uniref:ATP-binding cassette domain-containing protein n=1 Tax=Ignisphaera cupida TaxID=3050454 RepID=A0ABD4Z802_9CREN|nr:ATP-binding cassette domain-containing protein [Ignisphaera sp. 4213-co]MDK6028435.1 ATP-binding cassette domain-containing protein [Ignisphaera sp. 4213-co]